MHAVTDPSALTALWMRACAMFARARVAIGEPPAIATCAALTRDSGRDIAGWLARLESIVRKLLLAMAAGIVQDEGRSALLVGARGLRPQIAPTFEPHARPPEAARSKLDLSQPETWPARFALAPPRDLRAVPERQAPRIRALWGSSPPLAAAPSARAPSHATEPALRFALRLEALRRVLDDPLPYAQRLARIFARLSRRYPEAAPRFAIAPARPCLPILSTRVSSSKPSPPPSRPRTCSPIRVSRPLAPRPSPCPA